MVWVIGLVVTAVVVVVAAVCVAVVVRRRAPTRTADPTPAAAAPVDVPMTGLEAALALVTDRDGRPIRERIDAETQHIDDLRVPDDTGPLLRRALDHVEQPGATRDQPAGTSPVVAPGDTT